MFTVVIADQTIIDDIQENRLFLKPFLDEAKVSFCAWNSEVESSSLREVVPNLIDTVDACEQWRAVVVCGEEGINRVNPFNMVEYQKPERKIVFPTGDATKDEGKDSRYRELEPLSDYLKRVRTAKFAAYDRASKQPLTKLMAFLCKAEPESPLEPKDESKFLDPTDGFNNSYRQVKQNEFLTEFDEYVEETAYKEELYCEITGGAEREISMPSEVICIARRVNPDKEYALKTSWSTHQELEYSSFYDWNLYFDRMRYLIFDMLPHGHRNYMTYHIRFLYVLLLIANHDIPHDCVQPNRVYKLYSENDEKAIRRLFRNYDAKLKATEEKIVKQLKSIDDKPIQHLTDFEAEEIINSDVMIPVAVDQKTVKRSTLFTSTKTGMTGDSPENEEQKWSVFYHGSRRTLRQYVQQTPRVLKHATQDMHDLDTAHSERAYLLNEFQRDDLLDYIRRQEKAMVEVETQNITDPDTVTNQSDKYNQHIQTKISSRLTRKMAIGGVAAAALMLFLGFLPLILSQIGESAKLFAALGIGLAACAILCLAGLCCLLLMRHEMRESYRWFNKKMRALVKKIDDTLALFSQYLSHACNVMRGYSILNELNGTTDPDTRTKSILKKHQADICNTREMLRERYARYLRAEVELSQTEVKPYDYDFTRQVDYAYPLPYEPTMKSEIDFMQKGNLIPVSVDFVHSITVRREELYD